MSEALNRFIYAQEGSVYNQNEKGPTYAEALQEIKNGHKSTHWIWYILPQMRVLGHSELSNYYGIQGREEAEEYMKHPVLGPRLIEVATAIYNSPFSAYEIFGDDTIKVYSCIKLFSTISDHPVFKSVLVRNSWH